MPKQIKPLLNPTDYVMTDGKTMEAIEGGEQEAVRQQEMQAYEKAGTPIYLLVVHSAALVTKNDAKKIKKELSKSQVKRISAANQDG